MPRARDNERERIDGLKWQDHFGHRALAGPRSLVPGQLLCLPKRGDKHIHMEDELFLTMPAEDSLLSVSGVSSMNRKPTVEEARMALAVLPVEWFGLSRVTPQTDNANHFSTRRPL